MFENFKAPNNSFENPENDEAWRELKESASLRVEEIIKENELPLKLESVDAKEIEVAREKIPEIIKELSYDESGAVKNENRYLVRDLSVYGNLVDKYFLYKKAPRPGFMVENDDGSLLENDLA